MKFSGIELIPQVTLYMVDDYEHGYARGDITDFEDL